MGTLCSAPDWQKGDEDMASSAFDFSDLFLEIEREVGAVMTSPESQRQLKEHARAAAFEYVYPLYGDMSTANTPGTRKYKRRYASGGLGDPDNYEVLTGDLELTVINNTTGNGEQPGESWTSGPINDIIEEGEGYGWRFSEIYMNQPCPRPFMQHGIDEFVDEYLLPEIHDKVFNK